MNVQSMTIRVFGLPCPKTERTLVNVEAAVSECERPAKVYHIADIQKMSEWGVVYTPTVLVNEKEKSSGRIPSVYEIMTWVQEESNQPILATK